MRKVAITLSGGPKSPATLHALAALEQALKAKGCAVLRPDSIGGLPGSAWHVDCRLGDMRPDEPAASAGSFVIRQEQSPGNPRAAVHGLDERGLSYGIFELAGQIESSAAPDPCDAFVPTRRSPDLAVRSACLFLHNRQIEEEWLYSAAYWERWFELLVKSRLNMFTLTFGHQTAYLAPPFPFLVDVPGYERLRTPSYTPADRRRNLEMLRRVSDMAARWGVEFTLGLWQAHAFRFGKSEVEGLSYDDLFDYCPKGLAIVLKECPNIRGVQLRINAESGIEEDHQARFFGGIFDVMHDSGRRLWLDVRAKGLRQETVDRAIAAGLDVTVSTKFWTEHLGLPHFQTRTNPLDENQPRRYGYWDLLPKKRAYRVLYQLWSFGAQKLLVWGSHEYARRFAQSCHLGDGAGFELLPPLSNKGYGNLPGGAWRIFADRAHEYTDWEFERYWAYYMSFGLAGFNSDPRQPVLEGEFRRRFGAAAEDVRAAYEAAGGILPLITASHSVSASCFGYWTEMHTGGLSDIYPLVPPGDVERFQSVREHVRGRLSGVRTAKRTPEQVAQRLIEMPAAVETALDRAAADPATSANREFAATRRDLLAQCALARYHAARKRSGTAWELFRATGDLAGIQTAVRQAEEALRQWERIVELTDGVYYDHMVFIQPERQVAHWKDELPYLRHDVERLRKVEDLFRRACANPSEAAAPVERPWYEYERKWKVEDGVASHWPGGFIPGEAPAYPQYGLPKLTLLQDPDAVVQEALAARRSGGAGGLSVEPPRKHRPPVIRHEDIASCRSGRDLRVRAVVEPGGAECLVRLHFRRLVQSEDWQVVEMKPAAGSEYEATIPAACITPEWDLMYAIEAVAGAEGGAFYPDMDVRAPYVVVSVTAQED